MQKANPSLLSMLFILFVGLKLTDHIDWSWPWVMWPMLLEFAVLLIADRASRS